MSVGTVATVHGHAPLERGSAVRSNGPGGTMGARSVDQAAADQHVVGPSGWRRAALGLLVGVAIGAAVGLLLPRDDGPRRPARTA